MPDDTRMDRIAVFAGLAYAGIIALGLTGELVLRAPLAGDSPAATAAAIAADPVRLRLAIMADAAMGLLDAALAVLLFIWFRALGEGLALGAMVFRLIQTALIAGNLLLLVTAARLAPDQPDLAALAFALHGVGYDLALLFFGIACLLLAPLVARDGRMPGRLGALLAAGGVVYLAGGALRIVAPDGAEPLSLAYAVPLAAEIWFCAALLLAGRSRHATVAG